LGWPRAAGHRKDFQAPFQEAITQFAFDDRAFLAMLFNSRRYQIETVCEEWSVGDPMKLRGPWLRRLTAEQLWDSTLTLLVSDLNERKSSRGDLTISGNSRKCLRTNSGNQLVKISKSDNTFFDQRLHPRHGKSKNSDFRRPARR
jgi:hypothetical protein